MVELDGALDGPAHGFLHRVGLVRPVADVPHDGDGVAGKFDNVATKLADNVDQNAEKAIQNAANGFFAVGLPREALLHEGTGP